MASGKLKLKYKGQLKNIRHFQQVIFTPHVSFSKRKNAEKLTKLHRVCMRQSFFKPFKSDVNCFTIRQRYRQNSADRDFL